MKTRENFAQTLTFLRFVARRERIMSTIWVLSLILVTIAVLPVQAQTYASEQSGDIFNNPTIIAMVGPIFGNSIAAKIAAEMLLFTILAVVIMNIFLVIRHTRKDEEQGRMEVLRSLPVGRLSPLCATLIFALIVNLAIALFISLGIAFLSIEGITVAGGFIYGFTIGISGILFASLTGLFCQLFQSARTTATAIFIVVGVMYILRAIGDMGWHNGNKGQEVLSFISPLGLALRTQAFAENHVFPLIILLALALAFVAIALRLSSLRDIDQGLIPAKQGNDRAGTLLSSSFGHSFKLVQNTIIGWAVSLFILCASFGSVMGDVEAMIAENEFLQNMLGGAGVEVFLGMISVVSVIMAIIPVLSIMLRLVAEENEGRIEGILATPIKRKTLFFNYLIIAAVSAVIMMFLTFFGLWLGSLAILDDAISFGKLFNIVFVYFPVLVFMLGLSALFVGVLPQKNIIIWLYLGFCFFITFFGPMLNLPEWTMYLTPLGYIPNLALETFDITIAMKILLLLALAVAFTIVGLFAYQKRDIKTA